MLEDGKKKVLKESLTFPRFFVTAPSPCPYLDGREERKVFTELAGADAAELHEALSRVGFRRSQSVAYRPACDGCNACLSVRVVTKEFKPSRSQRRVLNRNSDVRVTACDPVATAEQYELLTRYLADRHAEGGMAEMDEFEFADMVHSSPVATSVIEYRVFDGEPSFANRGKLLAAAITDIVSDGLSMVYSFFDPTIERRSIGSFMILDHIQRARSAGLDYVYLGYWVPESPKMGYKAKFQPLEILGMEGWKRA